MRHRSNARTCWYKSLALSTALAALFAPAAGAAQITVAMDDPQWTFLLKNNPGTQGTAELSRDEGEFFRNIQPLLSSGNYAGALAEFEKRNSNEDGAALHELRGQILLNLKRYNDAERALNKALELQPGLSVSHRALGMLHLMQKDYKNARRHLVKTIELGGGDAQTYGQLAYVNLQTGKPHTAVAGYQNALFLDADNTQWYQGLLYALIQSDDLTQAGSLVNEMLVDDPDNRKLWLQRAQIAMRAGDDIRALASMETALELGEKRADNIAMAAQLHMQQGSPDRAVELLASDLRKFVRSDNIDTVYQMAAWMASRDQWTPLARLLKAVDGAGKSIPAQERAGFLVLNAQMAMANRHYKTAHSKLNQAIDLSPAHGEALLTMARLQRQRNNLQSADMYYLRAEALDDYKARALQGRAQVEIDRKDYASALKLLRKLYKEEPGRQQVFENIQALERIVRNQA